MVINMIYGYFAILGCYFLLFILSHKKDVSAYRDQAEKQDYPGGALFLKASVWCMDLKKRLTAKSANKEKRQESMFRRKQMYGNRLGTNLRLLNPSMSEKQQVQEFYLRQCSLVLLILFVGDLLCLGIALSGRTGGLLQEGNYINRNTYGAGDVKIALSAQIEGEDPEEILYTVEEQKYTEEEVNALYREASACLTEVILGGNSSPDRITEDLDLVTSIGGYPFQISWDSSNYSLIHTDGSVHNEILEDAQVVTLTAYFRYEGMEFKEIFPIEIHPAVYTEKELLTRKIEASLEEQNQASRTDDIMKLPEKIGTKNVVWKEVIQDSSGYFFLLLLGATVLIFFSGDKEVERNLEKRKKELLLDYPEIVNKLTLYMGAGMTIRNAFFKMGEDYKKVGVSHRKRYVYEEILLLCHELQSGVSETEAYAHLGKRCQLQVYMKLCALLSQNLRRGSNDLLAMLRQEAVNAFEERKNTAKKMGEEAGTKLLLPMMMMLCIVMALIMIPAFLSFS